MTRLRRLAALALSCGLVLVPSLAAGSTVSLDVARASLRQDGRDLVWSVRLTGAFSPGALQRERRSLCLELSSPRGPQRICVIGPATGRRNPRVVQQFVTHGRRDVARVIPATVTRSDDAQISVRLSMTRVARPPTVLRWQVSGPAAAYPRSGAGLRLHLPLPIACIPAGSSEVFAGDPRSREVALTFDDGPWGSPPSSEFLDVLEREHVVATFFEIGRQIATYDPGGRLERRMLADGDFIGDHSWSHPVMTRLSSAEQRSQLESTAAAIRSASGLQTCLWRPPYGAVDSSIIELARSLGLLTIGWDVDPRDWSTPGTAAIYSAVVGKTHSGSIVLQHFGGGPRYETLAAVPQEIRTLRARGYRFVTIPQLLGLRVLYR